MLERAENTSRTLERESQLPAHDRLLRDAIDFCLAGWKIVAASCAVTVFLALIYVAISPTIYTARTLILIDTRSPQRSPLTNFESIVSLDTPQFESQLVLLRSQHMVELVAKQHKVADDITLLSRANDGILRYILFGIFGTDVKKLPPQTRLELAKERLANGIEASRVRLSYALELTFRSPSAKKAAFYANAFADAYIADQIETRSQSIRQSSKWLEERLEDLRQRMNLSARAVQAFRARRDYRIPGMDGTAPQTPQARDAKRSPEAERSTLEELETRAEAFKSLYKGYLQAYVQSDQVQSNPAVTARVISRAVQGSKSHPRTVRTLLVAAIAGVLLGLAVLFFRAAFTTYIATLPQREV